jgi:hypothetical protein
MQKAKVQKEHPMSNHRLNPLDVVITLVVGLVVALGLEAPNLRRGLATGDWGLAPTAAPAPYLRQLPPHPAPGLPILPVLVQRASSEDLAGDPLLRRITRALGEARAVDLVALAEAAGLEQVDLGEHQPPRLLSPGELRSLLDPALTGPTPRPRLVGWFQQVHVDPDRIEEHPVAQGYGLVTCCWPTEVPGERAPAGWHVTVRPEGPRWDYWAILGRSATVDDLIRAWIDSGEWDATADRLPATYAAVTAGGPGAER